MGGLLHGSVVGMVGEGSLLWSGLVGQTAKRQSQNHPSMNEAMLVVLVL